MNVSKSELNQLANALVKRVANISNHQPKRKGPKREEGEQSVNLRCTKDDCDFLAKTTAALLEKGRLRCPIHHTILRTKEERGEHRGRHSAAA